MIRGAIEIQTLSTPLFVWLPGFSFSKNHGTRSLKENQREGVGDLKKLKHGQCSDPNFLKSLFYFYYGYYYLILLLALLIGGLHEI